MSTTRAFTSHLQFSDKQRHNLENMKEWGRCCGTLSHNDSSHACSNSWTFLFLTFVIFPHIFDLQFFVGYTQPIYFIYANVEAFILIFSPRRKLSLFPCLSSFHFSKGQIICTIHLMQINSISFHIISHSNLCEVSVCASWLNGCRCKRK